MSVNSYETTPKQEALIEMLLGSPDTFARCETILLPDYFNPELKNVVRFVKEYYAQYNSVPDIFQIKAETGRALQERNPETEQINWTLNETESFCRHRGIVKAIGESLQEIQDGNYGGVVEKVQAAAEISLHRHSGLDYFVEIEERIKQELNSPKLMSLGWKELDDLLGGGMARGELLLVAAPSGGGKSLLLANLGYNFLEQQYNVMFLSLELSVSRIAQRYDQMFTGIDNVSWKWRTEEVITGLQSIHSSGRMGNLDITKMPSETTPNEVRSLLKEFYLKKGYYPDLLIVDYLDEMSPNQFVSADNVAEKDKQISSQLRQVGEDFDALTATASQLNREAIDSPIRTHAHIAGGMGKIRVSDAFVVVDMTPQQKARGVFEMQLLKTRNSDGVGSTIFLEWVREYLRIRDGNKSDKGKLEFVRKEQDNSKNDNDPEELVESNDETINALFDMNIKTPNL